MLRHFHVSAVEGSCTEDGVWQVIVQESRYSAPVKGRTCPPVYLKEQPPGFCPLHFGSAVFFFFSPSRIGLYVIIFPSPRGVVGLCTPGMCASVHLM